MITELPENPAAAYPLPSSGDGILSAQASTLIGVETGIKTIAAVHSQCCLMGHSLPSQLAPVPANVRYAPNSDKKWCSATNDAMCQSRPMHRSKQYIYSITSSASASSV
jgi:hypothetical protein